MEYQTRFQRFINYEPYLHVLFWATTLSFPYIKFLGKEGGYPNSIGHELNVLFFHIIAAYFVYFVVLRAPIKKMIIPLLAVFLACAYGQEYFDSFFHDENFQNFTWKQLLSHFMSYTTYGLFFFAVHVSKEAYFKQQELLQLHREHQVANIAALKAQITPHFLFNTLNSIYLKAQNESKETASLILKLSDNTRYFLKEGQEDRVALNKEMTHIANYIQLQKERWKDKIDIDFIPLMSPEDLSVAPLIFIPFVENAFKYTSQLRGTQHLIKIHFFYEDGKLLFTCTNPFRRMNNIEVAKYSTGIGIDNVKKRLQLIYGDQSELSIVEKDGWYSVKLIIQTK